MIKPRQSKFFKHGEYLPLELMALYANAPNAEDIKKSFIEINQELEAKGENQGKYDKTTRVSDTPTDFGLVRCGNQDAICYKSVADSPMRGAAMIPGLGLLILGCWGAYNCLFNLPDKELVLVGYIVAFIALTAGVLGFTWVSRQVLFQIIDQPIIFDRKNRKVYRIFSDMAPGIKGLLQPWPICACEYDWDLTTATHSSSIRASTATVSRSHSLNAVGVC